MRRLSARSLASSKLPTFSICAPVRPSMPSGLLMKSIVASETIWSSSVIAKRWKKSSLSPAPGDSVDASKPRSAIRLVTRANALRPLSVNSIVTSGALVFGSVLASGFLMSSPDSSESSSSTVKRLICGGWLGAGSCSRTTTPSGTLITREPAGGPPEPSASSSVAHSVPFANSGAGPDASS